MPDAGTLAAATAASAIHPDVEELYSGRDGTYAQCADGSVWYQNAQGDLYALGPDGTYYALGQDGFLYGQRPEGGYYTWAADGTPITVSDTGEAWAYPEGAQPIPVADWVTQPNDDEGALASDQFVEPGASDTTGGEDDLPAAEAGESASDSDGGADGDHSPPDLLRGASADLAAASADSAASFAYANAALPSWESIDAEPEPDSDGPSDLGWSELDLPSPGLPSSPDDAQPPVADASGMAAAAALPRDAGDSLDMPDSAEPPLSVEPGSPFHVEPASMPWAPGDYEPTIDGGAPIADDVATDPASESLAGDPSADLASGSRDGDPLSGTDAPSLADDWVDDSASPPAYDDRTTDAPGPGWEDSSVDWTNPASDS